MIKLELSNTEVHEIINVLKEHSKRWKIGMDINDIPFSDDVIEHIKKQMATQQ